MIKLAHQRPVYMVAFDHRRSLRRALSAIGANTGPAHLSELKQIVWQGLKTALPDVAEDADVAVLIDRGNERIGREADSAGVRVALALEESGGDTLRPDAAAAVLRRELLALRGGFGKVLMRWHPGDPDTRKRRQLVALRDINDVISDSGAELLLELLIHPRPHDGLDESSSRLHTDGVLAGLQRAAAEEILSSGISPALVEDGGSFQRAGGCPPRCARGIGPPGRGDSHLGGRDPTSAGCGRRFPAETATSTIGVSPFGRSNLAGANPGAVQPRDHPDRG